MVLSPPALNDRWFHLNYELLCPVDFEYVKKNPKITSLSPSKSHFNHINHIEDYILQFLLETATYFMKGIKTEI